MKCPHCGHWNRASFPRCFRCGTPLPTQDDPAFQPPTPPPAAPSSKVYIQINEEGQATSEKDRRDAVAEEMREYAARKRRGEMAQQQLRQYGAQQGFAPTGRSVQTMNGRAVYHTAQRATYSTDKEEIGGEVRPDAIQVPAPPTISYDEYGDEGQGRVAGMTMRHMKLRRRFGLRRFTRLFAILVLIGALGFGGWKIYDYTRQQNAVPPLQDLVSITPSIYNDLPAHRIRIPGEEGQIIWIKELRQNVPVVGGYATVEVNDYIWYEDDENQLPSNTASPETAAQEEIITATAILTPYLKTSAGEQKAMGQITYEVDIPLSPLMLVSPSSNYAEVAVGMYSLKFEVAAGSTVIVQQGNDEKNRENLTDLVNANAGEITYNAEVSPIGDNEIYIFVQAPYCRENSIKITLHRPYQQIQLDLAADTSSEWRPSRVEDKSQEADENGKYPLVEQKMTIKGTTVSWANIRVLSDHQNLDLTRLAADGSFSFEPIFDHIGTNTIIIEASAPGIEPSIVKHDVYYVPVADIYTRNVWDMDEMYTDYLNNMERRVANTQKYQCLGTIIEVKSDKPQLAVMKLDSDYERTVLIYNYSNDSLEVGKRYKVFGDAFGSYDGAPWINGRYTYIQSSGQ